MTSPDILFENQFLFSYISVSYIINQFPENFCVTLVSLLVLQFRGRMRTAVMADRYIQTVGNSLRDAGEPVGVPPDVGGVAQEFWIGAVRSRGPIREESADEPGGAREEQAPSQQRNSSQPRRVPMWVGATKSPFDSSCRVSLANFA